MRFFKFKQALSVAIIFLLTLATSTFAYDDVYLPNPDWPRDGAHYIDDKYCFCEKYIMCLQN